MSENVLTTRGLTKSYGGRPAVNNVSMTVDRGDIYGFVGLNGSGKTTLIRLVTGLIAPSAGNFSLFGAKNDKQNALALRRVACIVETPSLYLNLSGRDNLVMHAKILGLDGGRELIDGLLERVNLGFEGHKKAGDYSLGMRQRLAIAMCLAGDPQFLLLDEPINGLDPQGIADVRGMIIDLNKNHGVTVLISSHVLGELTKLNCTKYGFIDKGHLLKEVTAEQFDTENRKKVTLYVSDAEKASAVLTENGIDHKLGANCVDIFGGQGAATELLLLENDVKIICKNEPEPDLEGYFLKMVGK